jgi:glycosyltransferase involved in cell wall biosynthesis
VSEKTIVHIITGLKDGGAEGALYRLVTNDRNAEHIIISLTGEDDYGKPLREAGIEVYALGLCARNAPKAAWHLHKLIRTLKPDVVQTWMYHADVIGGIVARLAGARQVFWGLRSGSLDQKLNKRSTLAFVKLARHLSRRLPKKIISCSDRAAKEHIAYGYAPDMFEVVHNGYDLEAMAFNPNARRLVRERCGIPENAFVVGMVARFDPQKDHGNLFEAIRIVQEGNPNVHLLLVGRGMTPDNHEVRTLVEKLLPDAGKRLHLAGPRTNVPDYYSAMDLHVLSSAYGEGFPNVVAESMACERPTVATDVGETDVILGDHGTLVPPRNRDALAMAIEDAVRVRQECPREYIAVGKASRQSIVDRFGISAMVKGFHEVWGSTVK